MDHSTLKGIIQLFQYYKSLGEKTFDQLTEKDLFWKYNEESNSIANIVQHLNGNMLSIWTDFLESDGEKTWRNRDAEFENIIQNKKTLLLKWNEAWTCLFAALESIHEDDLEKIVYIRNEGHTVLEAIHRQLAHYPYHIGQIVFIGKMLTDKKWKSLSIPKGNSDKYNSEKFASEKSIKHFTNEHLKK